MEDLLERVLMLTLELEYLGKSLSLQFILRTFPKFVVSLEIQS